MAIFIIAVVSIAHIFLGANYSASYSVERSKAMLLAREGIEAIRSLRDDNFDGLSMGNFGISLSGQGKFITVTDYDITDDIFTRQINLSSTDSETWKVKADVSWTSITGSEASVSLTERLTAWRKAIPE